MAQDLPAPEEDHEAPFGERFRVAAREAEVLTGRREETEAEIRHSLALRLARTVAGFLLIALGILGLVFPGPGWLIIVLGLSLLPYAWAERTVRLIRRRIPGIPEEGRIGVRQWFAMGCLVAVAITGSFLWADDVSDWAGDTWSSVAP